jgi:two-component system sensor histidine kinase RegB
LQTSANPIISSKQRPGSGLGLFLVVNVARILGGSAQASNRHEGGAMVTLTLPLSAIELKKEPAHGKRPRIAYRRG